MKRLEHFVLPEHTNSLYQEEAISSISLTRDVAKKINELVDAYNLFSDDDLTWKQEMGRTIEKGVLFMKDNLINSLHDLLSLYGKDEDVKNMIMGMFQETINKSKFYMTPQMFGAVGDGLADDTDAFKTMFASGAKYFLFDGEYLLTQSVEIPDGVTLESNGATFKQPNFGQGVFKTSGSNIHFVGTFNFLQTGNKVKLSTEGVECSALLIMKGASNITIDTFNICNFIGGVVFGGNNHKNININFVHVEKCDFGLWGANVHNLNVETLSFKDVDYTQNEPAHALYLTGNDRAIKSTEIHIKNVIGSGCVTGASDAVLSVKATSGFRCDNMSIENVNCAFTTTNSSGYIKNAKVNGVYNYAFLIQGNSPDGREFHVKDCTFSGLDCSWYCYSVGADGYGLIEDCVFDGKASEGFVYLSNLTGYEERNCRFTNKGSVETCCYNIASANKGIIYNPTIKGMKMVKFIQSGVNFYFYINPENLNSFCNQVTYHTNYLDNEYFIEVIDVSNNAIYNNIIAKNASITRLRGNGIVTLVNKDNSSFIMNTLGKFVLKNGATQYKANEWTFKMFRLVNDIAYEM